MPSRIALQRSIIPACDVDPDTYGRLIQATHGIEKVGAYKLGSLLALSIGLPKAVEIARKYTEKPLIYDHQKAGTDIPETAAKFVRLLRDAGIDMFIIFPFTGPTTQRAWCAAAAEFGIGVLVGGEMTHENFLASDGGYLSDTAVESIYLNAVDYGVRDYVLPGNKPDRIRHLRSLLRPVNVEPVFYSPGIGAQGGGLREAAQAAGPNWHAIVGRSIYAENDMARAAEELAQDL